ncbi:glutamate--cysteine ligase [Rothia sp. CCM 9418]|uniref:glutamate--cysteine ligase n=1 Tax=Rothia sp. CCM 9418 TaxID=3402661 RepID=UPI003AEADA35
MIPFAPSAPSTLGVEWELALVDAQTQELCSRAQEVLALVQQKNPELLDSAQGPHLTGEFLDNTLELVTGVCTTVAEAIEQLHQGALALQQITDELGIEFFSAGTHPFSRSLDQPVASKERYLKMLDRTQYWGRQMVIYGVHVHVGVNSRDKALPIIDGLTTYYPHLLALSASSPFWEGVDTGYASQRALMFQQLPTAGLPFHFESWEDYENYLQDMLHTGVIDDPSENRWDIRPVPHYGTVEMRICDGLSSLKDIAAIAALTQCLVESFSRKLDKGERIEALKPWHVQENKWRAARYGLDAIIIQNNRNDERHIQEDLRELIDRLYPIAHDLGCTEELKHLETIISSGGNSARQRHVAQSSGGNLRAVVKDLVAQRIRDSASGGIQA